MAQLKITEIKCVKKKTTVGKDKIRIAINGVYKSGPHILGRGDSLDLAFEWPFEDTLKVQLWEEDKGSGNDDCLGTYTVKASEIGLGTRDAHFNDLKGADYHMEYNVTS